MSAKTLVNILENSKKINPNCPECQSNKRTIKAGTRHVKNETIQLYFCKLCSKRFSNRKIQRTSYHPKVILNALTYFNLGHTLAQTTQTMREKYKTNIPISTLNNWTHRFENDLPFIRIRRRYQFDPDTIIKKKYLQHQQPYLFQVNSLKLNFAGKEFPQIKRYINSMLNDPKNHVFNKKDIFRCSELARTIQMDLPNNKHIKSNLAIKMANFASALTKTKKERHQTIEDFFIINDSVTIASEVPVYLLKEESIFENDLVGHIDIIQVRNNKIHVIDYKPDMINERYIMQQLSLYTLALTKQTRIPISRFVCGFFNDKKYYQFTPDLKSF